VTSPTFVLEKRYDIPHGPILNNRFSKLIHVDAYRLHGGSEMKALDWTTTLAEKRTLILLEWPEQVADALPSDMLKINFEYIDEGVRQVSGDEIK
jgi:tRNA threonylcarbamoyladenosine biosynthesis protein TsaE